MLIPIICWLVAVLFFIIGITASCGKKPAGIYSNIKAPDKEKIPDLKAYNKAVGKLFFGYGLLQMLTGFSLIDADTMKIELLLTFSFFFGAVLMMIVYEVVIVPKYIK